MTEAMARQFEQIKKAQDALDSKNPDHDTIRERLVSVTTYVTAIRAAAWQEDRERQVKKIAKALESTDKKIKVLPDQKKEA